MPPISSTNSYLIAANQGSDEVLICDPQTGLVSYPSFERFLRHRLDDWLRAGLHLAIGDVDDLGEYISQKNHDDDRFYGHLAGNNCMCIIGEITRTWHNTNLSWAKKSILATFGGDEVIVAAIGGTHAEFSTCISSLASLIEENAPRPCSFVTGHFQYASQIAERTFDPYRSIIGQVDEALLQQKERRKREGSKTRRQIWALGTTNIPFRTE